MEKYVWLINFKTNEVKEISDAIERINKINGKILSISKIPKGEFENFFDGEFCSIWIKEGLNKRYYLDEINRLR